MFDFAKIFVFLGSFLLPEKKKKKKGLQEKEGLFTCKTGLFILFLFICVFPFFFVVVGWVSIITFSALFCKISFRGTSALLKIFNVFLSKISACFDINFDEIK